MGFLVTDDSQAGNMDFEPLPIGDYECIISKVEVVTSSSGNPMIKVELTVRDDGVNETGAKRKMFDNLVQTEKAMFKFHQVSKAVGIPSGTDFGTIEEFARAIAYKPVLVRNKHETYNDKVSDKVVGYKLTAHPLAGSQFAGQDPFADDGVDAHVMSGDLPF